MRRYGLLQLVAYLLLATVTTRPLIGQLGGTLVQGTESAATVPLFTTWTVWWNADRASHGFAGYWDAPIFHPESDTFAFSEPLATSAVVAPLWWATGNPVLAHNVFLLLALTLNGWSAFLLLRQLRIGQLGASVGGGLVAWLPMVQNELGVLQLVPLFGFLGTVGFLSRLARRPRVAPAIGLGVMAAITYLTCANYGLYASVLLLAAGPCLLGRRMVEMQTWRMLVISAAIALAITAPVTRTQLRVSRSHGLVRAPELVARLSAQPADYWPDRPFHNEAIPKAQPVRQTSRQPLGPGWLVYCLALVGVAFGLVRRRHRPWTGFWVTLSAFAVLLSLGPNLRVLGWGLYETLWHWYPGFAQVRSPFRMAIFFQLAVMLLAACGLNAVLLVTKRWHTHWLMRIVRVGIGAVVVAAIIEIAPMPQTLYAVPSVEPHSGWIGWLKRNTAADGVIACLPFPEGGHVRDYEQTALYMYWGAFHGRPLINGYSGFLPDAYVQTKLELKSFPNAEALARLRLHRVDYCVIFRSYFTRSEIELHPITSERLDWMYGDDDAGVDIYRLRAGD